MGCVAIRLPNYSSESLSRWKPLSVALSLSRLSASDIASAISMEDGAALFEFCIPCPNVSDRLMRWQCDLSVRLRWTMGLVFCYLVILAISRMAAWHDKDNEPGILNLNSFIEGLAPPTMRPHASHQADRHKTPAAWKTALVAPVFETCLSRSSSTPAPKFVACIHRRRQTCQDMARHVGTAARFGRGSGGQKGKVALELSWATKQSRLIMGS